MRFLKQFFFGIVWVLILALIVYVMYALFLRPAPSCTDNIKNGEEEAIDCGPVCGKQCLPAELKISVRGNIRIIPVATSSDRVSILVQLQNAQSDYAAKNFSYNLKLAGENGFALDIPGSSFMYAGELKYLTFPNLTVSEPATSLSASFEVGDVSWVKDETFKKPTIFLQNQITSVYSDRIEVVGKFTNGDAATLERASIVAVLLDSRGNIIGVSGTRTENVASGETRAFTITHPFVPGINVSATQVFVYPYKP